MATYEIKMVNLTAPNKGLAIFQDVLWQKGSDNTPLQAAWLTKTDARNYSYISGENLTYSYYADGSVKGLTGGTIESVNIVANGVSIFSGTDMSVSASAFTAATKDDSVATLNSLLFSGSDTISGSGAKDVVHGGTGNEVMSGEGGNDTLFGDAGRDRIDGGAGRDILTGGAGADVFVFKTGYGSDRISDFKATTTAHDRLDLSDWTVVYNYTDLVKNHMSQVGNNVLIDGAGTDQIVLSNVKIAQLDAGDFIF